MSLVTRPALTRELVFDKTRGTLLAERKSACGRCAQAGRCGSAALTRTEQITSDLPPGVADGARYTARFPAADLLLVCALVFPLLALAPVGGAVLAALLLPGSGDPAAAAGACIGVLVGVAGLKLYDSASGSRGILARLVIVPSERVDTVGS